MAQNTDQWLGKLQKFVPGWMFSEDSELSVAVFTAMAALFSGIQQDADDQQAATFILTSPGPVLDLIGSERSIPRDPGELDAAYAVRIQNGLFTPVGATEIQALVNSVLNNGPALFIENSQYGFFDDTEDEFFYDDPDGLVRWLNHKKWYNWWTLVTPIQTGGSDPEIQAALVAIIEANKALGTTYDILYGSTSDTDPED